MKTSLNNLLKKDIVLIILRNVLMLINIII